VFVPDTTGLVLLENVPVEPLMLPEKDVAPTPPASTVQFVAAPEAVSSTTIAMLRMALRQVTNVPP
jgi:hypothetical protein